MDQPITACPRKRGHGTLAARLSAVDNTTSTTKPNNPNSLSHNVRPPTIRPIHYQLRSRNYTVITMEGLQNRPSPLIRFQEMHKLNALTHPSKA